MLNLSLIDHEALFEAEFFVDRNAQLLMAGRILLSFFALHHAVDFISRRLVTSSVHHHVNHLEKSCMKGGPESLVVTDQGIQEERTEAQNASRTL